MSAEDYVDTRKKLIEALGYPPETELTSSALMLDAAVRIKRLNAELEKEKQKTALARRWARAWKRTARYHRMLLRHNEKHMDHWLYQVVRLGFAIEMDDNLQIVWRNARADELEKKLQEKERGEK